MQTMAETATETITIAASPDKVWDIATDIEQYPVWTNDVKDVVITSRDDEGRPMQVVGRAKMPSRPGSDTPTKLATPPGVVTMSPGPTPTRSGVTPGFERSTSSTNPGRVVTVESFPSLR